LARGSPSLPTDILIVDFRSIMDGNTESDSQAIHEIAIQFARPYSEVHELLYIQISRLNHQARIKQYVSLLAIKQVKDLLRRSQHTVHVFSADPRPTRMAV